MASRTRKQWCASDVLVRLTLILSGLCIGRCADFDTTTMTPMTSTMPTTSPTISSTTSPTMLVPVAGTRECVDGARTTQSEGEVKLAVIAPGDPHHEQSLPRVLPAVLLAVRYVSSPRGPLPGWSIKVDHRDSHCSSTYGPLAAFEFYINQTAGHNARCVFHTTLSLSLFSLRLCFFLLSLSFISPSLRNRETRVLYCDMVYCDIKFFVSDRKVYALSAKLLWLNFLEFIIKLQLIRHVIQESW